MSPGRARGPEKPSEGVEGPGRKRALRGQGAPPKKGPKKGRGAPGGKLCGERAAGDRLRPHKKFYETNNGLKKIFYRRSLKKIPGKNFKHLFVFFSGANLKTHVVFYPYEHTRSMQKIRS